MTFPITIGNEYENTVVIKGVSKLRLEYACKYDEVFIIASNSLYRIQEMVKNKIAAGTKLILRNNDILEVNGVTLEISIDKVKGDILARNTKARLYLEEIFGKLWLIGYGGIASVYAPENMEKALKVLAKGHADRKIVQRFEESSGKIRGLDHLGLLKMGNTHSLAKMMLYYTEMEYCRGVTMAEWIARKGTTRDNERSFTVLKGLAQVMAYISSHNITHRDIHPKNILIEDNLTVKLLGFTLIKSIDSSLTQKGTRMFTPNFTAPEQIVDPSSVDSKADVYSLGAISYYLLAGLPPFGATNHSGYIKLLQKKTIPVPLQDIDPTLPPEVYSLVSRSLSYNRANRPDIHEILDIYEHILRILPSESHDTRKISKSLDKYWGSLGKTQEIRKMGRFKILNEVGHGGLGRVYKAIDTKVDRKVALKLLRRGIFADEKDLWRFQEEARLVSRLNHPGVAKIYEIGREEGNPYILMELIDGETLDNWGKDKAPREIAEKIKEIAEILDYAHGESIIHRDIKPSNIMIRQDGDKPVLLDFGMARELRDNAPAITKTSEFSGTLVYAPPELFGKESPSPAMDVYSLGIVFYELLTGQLPYGDNPVQLMTMMVKSDLSFVAPSSLNFQIASDLETICLCAMAFSPRNRYESAKALAQDIERYLQGEVIKANPPSIVTRAWCWTKRHRRYIVPAIVGSAILILALIYIPTLIAKIQGEGRFRDLDKAQRLLLDFPGSNPRENFRETRILLESARFESPKDPEIKETLSEAHLKFAYWALKHNQLDLARDRLASLQNLAEEKFYREFARELAKAEEIARQRQVLVDWQQPAANRIIAAKALAYDMQTATRDAFNMAQYDPANIVRETVKKIMLARKENVGEIITGEDELENNSENGQREKMTKRVSLLENLFPPYPFPSLVLLMMLVGDSDDKSDKERMIESYFQWLETTGGDKSNNVMVELTKILHCPNARLRRRGAEFSAYCRKRARPVVPDLVVLLGDRSKSIHRASFLALCKVGQFAPNILTQALVHPKNSVSKEVAKLLVKIGPPALPALLDSLRHPQKKMRDKALSVLKNMGVRAIPFLIENLTHPQSKVREQVSWLIVAQKTNALPDLLNFLRDNKKPAMQQAIIEIIERIGPSASKAGEQLIAFLDSSKNPDVRYKSLKALLKILPQEKRLTILIQRLDEPHPEILELILLHLQKLGKQSKIAIPKLLSILAGQPENIQVSIIDTFAAIGSSAKLARSRLNKIFTKSSAKTGYAIAHALVRINHSAYRNLQRDYLCLQGNEGERAKALKSLEKNCYKSKDDDTLLFFLAATRDPSELVCTQALKILGKFSPPSPAILNAVDGSLAHSFGAVRQQAIKTLGFFGSDASKSIDKLLTMLRDPKPRVRLAVVKNIFKITPPTPAIIASILDSLPKNTEADNTKIMEKLLAIHHFPTGTCKILLPYLQGSPTPRYQAISLLGQMGHQAKAAIPYFLQLYAKTDPKLRDHLELNLQKLGLPSVDLLPQIEECLKHYSPDVRIRTLQMAAKMGSKAAPLWDSIVLLFKGVGVDMETLLKNTLAKVGKATPKDIPTLVEIIKKESNRNVRFYAIEGLIAIGAKAKPAMSFLLKVVIFDHDVQVRTQAGKALMAIGHPAIKAMGNALQHENDKKNYKRIISLLSKIGENAIPELLLQLSAENQDKFESVARGLKQIGAVAVRPLLKLIEIGDKQTKTRALQTLRLIITSNTDIRATIAAVQGLKELHYRLKDIDPDSAGKIRKILQRLGKW